MANPTVTPLAAPTPSVPTPTAHELTQFTLMQMAGVLPRPPFYHAQDGSPIDPQSFDPTAKTTSFP